MGNKASSLFEAAREGDIAKVKELVRGGASINAKSNDGDTALILAAEEGHVGVVRCLVDKGPDIEAKSKYGYTALMRAARNGHVDVVWYLVVKGADKEAKSNDGDTALMWAAQNGHVDVVWCLVVKGADIEAKDKDGWTALIWAAFWGRVNVVQYLVKQGADKEAKNKHGYTALMWAAQKGHLDVVQYLVEQSADKEVKDKDGDTALIRAAQFGHMDVVQYLVEQSADKEVKDKDGDTALIRAAQFGHMDVVQYLVEKGADKEAKNNDGYNALIVAAREGHMDVVRCLVYHGADIMVKDNDDKTALMKAAEKGHLDIARYLVEQGVDKEAKNSDGKTALMWAAKNGHLDVVRYLVEQRADASCIDSHGNSALVHLLDCEVDEDEIVPLVKLLLERRAPPLKSNYQGISAKSIARKKNFNNVIDLLDEYAAKPWREPDSKWFISPETVEKIDGVQLGQGSFGAVYFAKWLHINVVMKIISVVEMQQFLKEVNTWRELRHDNVVPFYGANHRNEPYFIVSKYASNGELRKYLASEKKQGRTVVWRKLREVAAGLSYLHSQGVVHGDLRGDNIVVNEHGTAMLTDFGLSFSESGSCSLVKMKDALGAMAWRAPEFAMMTVEIPTRKSDVFSLGMCIIEAVKDAAPWGEHLSSDDIRQIYRNGSFKIGKPAELTEAQWDLVKKMIAPSPNDRPDLVEVVNALEHFAVDEECTY